MFWLSTYAGRRGWVNAAVPRTKALRGDEKGQKHRLSLGFLSIVCPLPADCFLIVSAKSLFSFFLVSPQIFSAGFSVVGFDFSSLKSESRCTPHRRFAGRRGWVNAAVPRTKALRGDEKGQKHRLNLGFSFNRLPTVCPSLVNSSPTLRSSRRDPISDFALSLHLTISH